MTAQAVDCPVVNAVASGGPIALRVASPDFPQIVAGRVWRYNADMTPDGSAGTFNSDAPDVPLGAPGPMAGKYFLVQGVVLHQNDDPPTQYQVVVSVMQGENVLHREVPAHNGSGEIGGADIPFTYRFRMEAV